MDLTKVVTKHSGTLGRQDSARYVPVCVREREREREPERKVTSFHPLGRFQKQQSAGYESSVNHLAIVANARDPNQHARGLFLAFQFCYCAEWILF